MEEIFKNFDSPGTLFVLTSGSSDLGKLSIFQNILTVEIIYSPEMKLTDDCFAACFKIPEAVALRLWRDKMQASFLHQVSKPSRGFL